VATIDAPESRRPRILVVDDEPDALAGIRVVLSTHFSVETAGNALEAIGKLNRTRYEAIVADERMPGMPGTKLLAYVRREYPSTVRVVLTAYSDPDAMLRAINDAEVTRFFIKPVDLKLLRTELWDAIRRRDAMGSTAEVAAEADAGDASEVASSS